jgi:hypothetical protein
VAECLNMDVKKTGCNKEWIELAQDCVLLYWW